MSGIQVQNRRRAVNVVCTQTTTLQLLRSGWNAFHSDARSALQLGSKALRMAGEARDTSSMSRSLLLVGKCEERLGRYERALEQYRRASALGYEAAEPRILAHAQLGIADTYNNIGASPSAMEPLGLALDLAVEGGLRDLEGLAHNSMGITYKTLCNYVIAVEHYMRAEDIFEDLGENGLRACAVNNIGSVHYKLGNMHVAQEHYLRCKKLLEPELDRRDIDFDITVSLNLGATQLLLGDETAALATFREALGLSRHIRSRVQESRVLGHLGALFRECNQPEKAYRYLYKSLEQAVKIGGPDQWEIVGELGYTHLKMGRPEAAIVCISDMLNAARIYRDRKLEFEAHGILARCYEDMKDPWRSLEHYKLYSSIKEEIAGMKQQQAIMQLQMHAELKRVEHERERLRLNTARLEQEVEHKSQELASMAMHLVEKNQFLGSLKREMTEAARTVGETARPALARMVREVDVKVNDRGTWSTFEEQFKKVHHEFLGNLSARYPELTRMELKIAALLKLNMSTKEIADLLSLSERNIRNHRYRLRKKLGLAEQVNLTTFLASL